MRLTGTLTQSGIMIFSIGLLVAFGLLGTACPKKPEPKPECAMDSDCMDGYLCEAGKCLRKAPPPPPKPECSTSADCESPKVCRNEKCGFECTGDTGCPAGQVCTGYRCVAQPECFTERVYFGFDEYFLTSDAQRVLRANAECIRQKKPARVTIEGHCDERGTDEYNMALGDRRAQSARTFLTDLGIDGSLVKTVSYGEERPVEPGHDDAAWSKNRRAETLLNE